MVRCYHHITSNERASPRYPPGNIHTSNNHGLMPLFARIYSKCTGAQRRSMGIYAADASTMAVGLFDDPTRYYRPNKHAVCPPLSPLDTLGITPTRCICSIRHGFVRLLFAVGPVLLDIISDLKDAHCTSHCPPGRSVTRSLHRNIGRKKKKEELGSGIVALSRGWRYAFLEGERDW